MKVLRRTTERGANEAKSGASSRGRDEARVVPAQGTTGKEEIIEGEIRGGNEEPCNPAATSN